MTSALLHLTEQAWQQLDDAEQRLSIVPVPVRPLQLALGRLDTFRMPINVVTEQVREAMLVSADADLTQQSQTRQLLMAALMTGECGSPGLPGYF